MLKRIWGRYRGMKPVWQIAIGLAVVVLVVAAVQGPEDEGDEASGPSSTTSTTASDVEGEDVEVESPDVWTYTDASGVVHEVECDDDTSCTSGTPDPVGLMDGMDCDGLALELDHWSGEVDSDNSDEYRSNAAAYAAWATDRMAELGC